MNNILPIVKERIKECRRFSLIHLDLNRCALQNLDFLSEIEDCKFIISLSLSHNQITDISFLENFHQIEYLDLDFNNISNIHPIENITSLTNLYLNDNKISNLRPLRKLKKLNTTSFDNNQIKYIPEFIFDWKNYEEIVKNLYIGNKITNPPQEKINQGKNAIIEWYNAKKIKFNEIKIILVGAPESGKTSLLKRLKHDEFNIEEKQTDGVNIVDINFGEEKTFEDQINIHDIKARFWDFGGQEILHSTHRLFLSSRAVYLLILQTFSI